MRSILSAALAAVMLLSVLTGCGRKKEDTVAPAPTAAATAAPTAAADFNKSAENDRVMPTDDGAVNDMMNDGENMVNDAVNGVESAVNDVVEGVENIPGDMEDGRVEDRDNTVKVTPAA